MMRRPALASAPTTPVALVNGIREDLTPVQIRKIAACLAESAAWHRQPLRDDVLRCVASALEEADRREAAA